MKQPNNLFLFFLCSIPSLVYAASFTIEITPASIKSGHRPFEFVVTPNGKGVDVSFSANQREDGLGAVRASLSIVEIIRGPQKSERAENGRLQSMGGVRTRRLRDIALQEKDGKTFVTFHIEPELLKKDNLSFVYVTSSNEGPVAAFYTFYIAAFLPHAEPDGADQPATAPESKSGSKVKPQPEAEGRSR